MILGLTGTVGSGKSTVARLFEELANAKVIDADAIAHAVQRPAEKGYAAIVKAFGSSILAPDGTIAREKLAKIVFSDPAKRELLNNIVHPIVREREVQLLKEYRGHPLVILMVPLLFENQMESLVDGVVVVMTDDTVRRERLKIRSGWSDEEISRRLAAQLPDEEKMRRADFVIWNNGSIDDTRLQVRGLLDKLGIKATA